MEKVVFIHTNERQWLGALVAAHSFRRNASDPDSFDIRFIHTRDHPWLAAREGQEFLRGGTTRVWRMDDLQSFTPLRFTPPQLMNYSGRAVVTDPDVFAAGDICELLDRDMGGAAVMGRHRSGKDGKAYQVATSVMLMDCARLSHWDAEAQFGELFAFEKDYKEWMVLAYEDPANIGYLEERWNDFDHLDADTRLLHNTKRRTQPWKTGLPVDYTPADKFKDKPLLASLNRLRAKMFGEYGLLGHYHPHPDPAQEQFFFGLLRECLDSGQVSEELVREEISRNHVRHDAFEVLARTPPLEAQAA
ncbi:hypothetical protein E4634_19970 [Mangrovimicrobium sediminis]|uniref:Uncharacterized protein n=1 Tax=Mangrovimicrobium sediminis TaxID=2562682 RepID=A0A4Z0LUY1_9GAMM|nr:hypothetical protein [Haliea sp. SAOS-164]TGD71122.1 hypothetical protein E4634_19970 [Haliea sp. SAOS-164]